MVPSVHAYQGCTVGIQNVHYPQRELNLQAGKQAPQERPKELQQGMMSNTKTERRGGISVESEC